MKYEKGDLIAIKTLDNRVLTAIILETISRDKFLYCFIVEDDSYKLIYEKEVAFAISKGFAPDFEYDKELFNLDYAYYETCLDIYSYAPFYDYFIEEEENSEDEPK